MINYNPRYSLSKTWIWWHVKNYAIRNHCRRNVKNFTGLPGARKKAIKYEQVTIDNCKTMSLPLVIMYVHRANKPH